MRNKMRPIHPGEILRSEFMEPLDLAIDELAAALSVPTSQLTAIVEETSELSDEIALRLSYYFGNSTEFWMNLQRIYDRRVAETE